MSKKKTQTQKEWLWEFSKKVVRISLNLWVVWNIYIMVIMAISNDYTNIAVIYPEFTQFVTTVISGYLLKAAWENHFKIKYKPQDEEKELDEPVG